MPDNDCFFVLNQQFLCSKSQATATSFIAIASQTESAVRRQLHSGIVSQYSGMYTPNQLTFTGQAFHYWWLPRAAVGAGPQGILRLLLLAQQTLPVWFVVPSTNNRTSFPRDSKWPSDVAAFQRAAIRPTGTLEAA